MTAPATVAAVLCNLESSSCRVPKLLQLQAGAGVWLSQCSELQRCLESAVSSSISCSRMSAKGASQLCWVQHCYPRDYSKGTPVSFCVSLATKKRLQHSTCFGNHREITIMPCIVHGMGRTTTHPVFQSLRSSRSRALIGVNLRRATGDGTRIRDSFE